MLLGGLDTTFEYIPSKNLVASEISTKYKEIKEVGNGSYGQAKKPSLQRGDTLNFSKRVCTQTDFIEKLR